MAVRQESIERLPAGGAARGLALGLLLLLAGCESAGFSAREDELARQRGEIGFAILERSERRAVFAANGQRIAVEPPEGYCLDDGSLAVSRRSAFALVADCMESQELALANGATGVDPPRPFPGILTVTVSGDGAFGEEPAAMSAFESLLGTPEGGRLLGRGEGTGPGRVVAAERADGALYVLIEEATAEGSDSIFAPRFWRSFTEINGRLVLVTVSSFSDRPLGEEEMLSFLAAQMLALRQANGLPAGAGEGRIEAAVVGALESAGPAETAGASGGEGVVLSPMPPPSPRRRPG